MPTAAKPRVNVEVSDILHHRLKVIAAEQRTTSRLEDKTMPVFRKDNESEQAA